MAHHPNFSAQLTEKELDNLRRLAKQLGFVLYAGQQAGQGSTRQIMIALSQAVDTHGVRHVAATLRPLFTQDEATAD